MVLEASSRLGGRAYATADGIDLGGSWVWSSNFPSTRKLVKELGVQLVRPCHSTQNSRRPFRARSSSDSRFNAFRATLEGFCRVDH